jgi:hypothetical protein
MMAEDLNAAVVVSSASGSRTGDGTVVTTPSGERNVVLTYITPFVVIAIRAGKTYVQTLIGLMTASVTGAATNVLPVGDFMHTLYVCAGLSVGAAVMSMLTNLAVFLTELGDKFPSLKV